MRGWRSSADAGRGGLFVKYVVAFVGLVLFVVATSCGLETWFTYRDAKRSLLRDQSEKAEVAARRIEQFVSDIERQIGWATRASASVQDQRRADYLRVLQDTPAIIELINVDGAGREQLRVSRGSTTVRSGTSYANERSFVEATANRAWFGVADGAGGSPSLTISMAHSTRDAGVTIARVNLNAFSDLLTALRVGHNGYAYLVSADRKLLAHSDAAAVRAEADFAALPQVTAASQEAGIEMIGRDVGGRSVLAASARVSGLNWSVLVEQPLTVALQPVYELILRLSWLLLMGLALGIAAGMLLARRMTVPIRALQAGAARFAAGDFDHHIEVRTGDEIEALADEFNRMARQLQESYTRLEQKVAERTRNLAQSVQELKALEEIGRAVASSLDLKHVLTTIVARAVELAGADGVAIYIHDTEQDALRLAEARGTDAPFPAVINRLHLNQLFPHGEGDKAEQTATVIADSASSDNEALRELMLSAGFRSVLLIPLIGPEGLLGALVVQRRAAGAFSQSTVELMQTFGHQSALAISNARLFEAVDEKNRQLAMASEHKSQFFANMSHELRTPLNAVLGFTELLGDGLYGELPAKAKEILGRIQSNGKHLLGLINDILDLSKMEAGQLTLSMDRYSMRTVVESVTATAESLARAKGIALKTSIVGETPLGLGDERRLTQVLLNIVGNAVKYTEQGSVEVEARTVGDHFEISVRDTGPGIAPEDQERIFESFQQVDNSNTRAKGGTGLGLAIAKHLVEMHGGRIALESTLGHGSTFRIDVPVQASEHKAAA